MNQQNNDKDPGRRSGDRKQVFGGSNLIWSLIAVAVAGLFAASLFSNGLRPSVPVVKFISNTPAFRQKIDHEINAENEDNYQAWNT